MSFRRILGSVLSVLFLLTALPGDAQDAAKVQDAAKYDAASAGTQKIPDGGMPRYIRPETPEERLARIATTEDPGLDPDPEKTWFRFGREYKILKFDKKGVRPAQRPGFVRAHPNLNLWDEMYQENDKWVWVWVAKPAKRTTAAERAERAKYDKFSNETLAYLAKIREDYEPLDPPKSSTKLKFEAASSGLPTSGSWRNHLAVADMNGDKFVDLVVPSQRGSDSGTPTIFLGDGKGGWKQWTSVRWPVRIDYGGVTVSDFNKDNKMDVAFAIHLKG
ncbi:MAG TPA: VCBS repeat-containing protein, partial [Thermoanaerobaculia bacterium]|nr:VCBS repeat-containing protein [Thermoanaerobaculia bacterium]